MNSNQFLGWLRQQGQPSLNNSTEMPLIMGVLNVTPDSFSDGGMFLATNRACEHAFQLIAEGVDLIDIGGESTRPYAQAISVDEELSRVIPVIEQIRQDSDVCISIDTNKPEVMEAAVHAGANVINDVYALRCDKALEMAVRLAVPVCLMHMQGEPQNMQQAPDYPNGVVKDIIHFFNERIQTCEQAGMDRKNIILDPGFGFGKRVQDNLLLVNNLEQFTAFKRPLLLGVSRKSTLGAILNKEVGERLIGGIAVAVYASLKGVGIIRTHDVTELYQALHMIHAIQMSAANTKI